MTMMPTKRVWAALLLVGAFGCAPKSQEPVYYGGSGPGGAGAQGGGGGGGGGSCEQACGHYVQCKGSADANLYQGCVQQCLGMYSDPQVLAQYSALDCPTAVSVIEGQAQPGGVPGQGPGMAPGGDPGMGGVGSTPATSGKTGLEDTWLVSDNKARYTVVLNADGTMVFNNVALKYSKTANKLTVTAPNGVSMTYDYKLDGDSLTMSGGDLPAPVTLGRSGSQRGLVAQIAGIYEGYESSLDPSIYISYTQYVTLYPDGSVGWSKAEGGASRTAVNQNWERFRTWNSSSGQFGNAGTWSSDGAGISVQWRLWGGKLSQGRIDVASGKFNLSGMGVLSEGATIEFKRN